jgi:mannose-6-phosphate isomerase
MDKIGVLKNPIQDYAWGSRTFIPQLIGDPVPADKPQAELWMGVHLKAPSQVLCDGEWISLPDLIQKNPEGILGESVAKKFSNKLPFLFKVLAAAKPLSIQAHPSRDQAREGFARENRLKIPLNALHRNYRDENHKPEMICALTSFWVLNGFRKVEDLITLTDRIGTPTIREKAINLRGQSDDEGLKGFFTTLMTMDRSSQGQMVTEVVKSCEKYSGTDAAFEWVIKLNQEYPGTIGVLSPIFMNVVRLQPGEAMYTPAGRLHAYLEGAGIELMANSDNVLRGGLTTKNIDVPGLLKILDFTTHEVDPLRPERRGSSESLYHSPAEEFMLSVISIGEGSVFRSSRKGSVEMMICLGGNARIADLGNGDVFSLSKGTSIIVPAAAEQYRIEGEATIYKAAVPL